jgi:hypothetical protein
MKLIAVTLFTLTSAISASPAASSGINSLSVRATKCDRGAVYCGWWLIDQNGNFTPNIVTSSSSRYLAYPSTSLVVINYTTPLNMYLFIP